MSQNKLHNKLKSISQLSVGDNWIILYFGYFYTWDLLLQTSLLASYMHKSSWSTGKFNNGRRLVLNVNWRLTFNRQPTGSCFVQYSGRFTATYPVQDKVFEFVSFTHSFCNNCFLSYVFVSKTSLKFKFNFKQIYTRLQVSFNIDAVLRRRNLLRNAN